MPDWSAIKVLLDEKAAFYEDRSFIADDPIQIPHRFSIKQDIEIMGFWTAILAWGQRKTIIKKAKELVALMDAAPYDFIKNHQEKDRETFLKFKHRTFQPTDTLYFLDFFQNWYKEHDTLEDAFVSQDGLEIGLNQFRQHFFSRPVVPDRTKKHVSAPTTGSTCKRINMFLRWMVRPSDEGVDFGLWKKISPAQLYIPFDVHVERIARQLQLVERKQRDWKTVLELTQNLRKLDPKDPVKYDFALFGMGVLDDGR